MKKLMGLMVAFARIRTSTIGTVYPLCDRFDIMGPKALENK